MTSDDRQGRGGRTLAAATILFLLTIAAAVAASLAH